MTNLNTPYYGHYWEAMRYLRMSVRLRRLARVAISEAKREHLLIAATNARAMARRHINCCALTSTLTS